MGVQGQAHVKAKVLKCIGVLGAFDPCYFRRMMKVSTSSLFHVSSLESFGDAVVFAVALIKEKLLSFLRSSISSGVQDRISFAIQELLKFSK